MNEQKSGDEQAQANEPLDLEGLIALVEARVIENLARVIEQMVEAKKSG